MPARRKRSLLPPGILGSIGSDHRPARAGESNWQRLRSDWPAHVARLEWSQDQIKAQRQRALRETLAFAKTKSPWRTPTFRAKPAAAQP